MLHHIRAVFAVAWTLCAASHANAGCDTSENKVDCIGCDFDTQESYDRIRAIASGVEGCWASLAESKEDPNQIGENKPPEGWKFEGDGHKLIKQKCRPWGGLDSGDGDVFYGLGRWGNELGTRNSLSRTFERLEKNGLYVLKFLAAERPNGEQAKLGGASDKLTVNVNKVPIVKELSPFYTFSEFVYHFRADDQGAAEIEFLNVSPSKEITVFLDKIEIFKSLDCGEGATCHEPLPPRTGYTCRCDVDGFKGHDVAGKQASCKIKSNGEALNEDLAEVKETVAALEDSAIELAGRTSGLQTSLDSNFAADATLQGAFNTMKGEFDAMKGDVADLKAQVATLLEANSNLKEVLAKSFAVGAVPSDSGSPALYAPSVAADEGSIRLDVQEGRHATVNGDALLTGEEVREMIRAAVADLLADMSTAL